MVTATASPAGTAPAPAPPAPYTGSHALCDALVQAGVELLFGYPGGAVIPLYDVLSGYGDRLRHVLVRHEQWAAHAAEGYARATGKVGVCLVTSGPGATNLVTGLADAMLDSVPVVAITGQVGIPMIGKDAFQEVDIVGVTLPITKHSYLVEDAADLPRVVAEAFHLARSGRPGPVLIDIPKSVLVARTEPAEPVVVDLPGYRPTRHGNINQIKTAARLLAAAERPVVMAGHGVAIAGATEELRQLVERCDLPVAFTLHGLGTLPTGHPHALGLMGMHGHAHVNHAVDKCDLLLNVGARFDDRATGRVDAFAPHATIIHIDIDPAEIGKNVRTDVPIVGDARHVLARLLEHVEPTRHDAWRAEIAGWRVPPPAPDLHAETGTISPFALLAALRDATAGEAIVTADVGQHQMWAAQHLRVERPERWITSGGLGTMGFGLPAAIGAQLGRPDAEVWAVVGDGGFQMSLAELATVAQERLPVKVAILNNGYLGMVRQWQDLFHNRNYAATPISGPDFVALARAYGITGIRVSNPREVAGAIARARAIDGPVVAEFLINPEENVYPMVPAGGANSQMIEADPASAE
ncbi:MAG TPA: biosynthetic-type acetolactate synthase large subunit [Thermomicrobiales bacterium]|nr:biosynthetic-type acetolactate synthase large subunit [Thermomicrobiales bacterium]